MNKAFAEQFIAYAGAISQSLNEQDVFDNALASLLAWPGVDAVWIYMTKPGSLRQVAGRAKGAVVVHAIDIDELATVALGSREAGVAPLPEGHPSGLGAIAFFPLVNEERNFGVLILGWRCMPADEFSEWVQEFGAGEESVPEKETSVNVMPVLAGMAGLLSKAILGARQHQQTVRIRDRLATLHTAVAHIQRAASLCDKMQMIANALHNMGWGHVTLWVCDNDMIVTDVVYAGISFQEESRLRQSAPPGLEFYGRSPQELQQFQIGSSYLVAAKAESSVGHRAGWKSKDVIYIPMRSGEQDDPQEGHIVGSIELRNPTDGLRPDPDQWRMFELFAREAVHEIERARQGDLYRQQVRDLAVLYEAGNAIFSHREKDSILPVLSRVLCDAAGAAYVCFVGIEPGNSARRVSHCYASGMVHNGLALPDPNLTYQLPQELIERAIEKRQTYTTELNKCSVLYLPVTMGEQVLGLIEIWDYRASRVFAERQIALCRAITNQAAVALSHARLYHDTAVERSRLRAILEASRDGIILVSLDARVLDLNGATCRLLRLVGEPEDWLGRSVLEIASSLRRRAPGAMRAILREWRRVRQGESLPGRGDFEVGGALPVFVQYTIYPVQVVSPKVTGWLILLHDTSEERALARTRDDLTHMLVHDLRSPLTAIISAVSLLRGGSLGEIPHEQYAMLNIVQRSSANMLNLITAILDIARLESGQMPLNHQPVSLDSLVAGVVEVLSPVAIAQQLRFSCALPDDLPDVWADQALIERVLSNLINNAVKFTPPGGEITLSAYIEGRTLVVAVTDTGPGIEPDLRDRLFQRFAAGRIEGRGSGLGLAFCKLTVEAHGGTIWVESPVLSLPQDHGPGSAFSFTLPIVV